MIGWLKNRKEKKEKRRQDKHRRILNALKYKDTTGSSSDYGFYSDEFNLNCETENKPHDYEEIDDMSVFALPPQFTRIVGTDFRFCTLTYTNKEQPPQLPARIFSTTARSVSVSACTDKASEDKFRERTISLPSFERNKKNFPGLSDCNEEPFYNEPWDCKSNLTVKCESGNEDEFSKDTIQVRLYEKINKKNTLDEKKIDSRWSMISVESKIYSEIEDNDTGCELDNLSQTESECSVFTNGDHKNTSIQRLKNAFHSEDLNADEASDSDASSGFYDEHLEIDEEHKKRLMKSIGRLEGTISSTSVFSGSPFRFHTYPRSPCPKIEEDAELYLIPKRSYSLKETRNEKLGLPVQKKKFKLEQAKGGNRNRNRLLDDLIWRNNLKQHFGVV
jgi:hypothetical protein